MKRLTFYNCQFRTNKNTRNMQVIGSFQSLKDLHVVEPQFNVRVKLSHQFQSDLREYYNSVHCTDSDGLPMIHPAYKQHRLVVIQLSYNAGYPSRAHHPAASTYPTRWLPIIHPSYKLHWVRQSSSSAGYPTCSQRWATST